jgi:phosphomannomutase
VPDLASIVKAYDIRGVVPDQLDDSVARAVGAAFVRFLGATSVVTGHDMRESSPGLARAFAEGATGQGADVIEVGLASTDLLYYASGSLDMPGAMFTASHNPARYNGIKLCRAGAAPVGQDTGLADIRDLAEQGIQAYDGTPGTITQRDMLADYAAYMKKLVPGIESIRRLSVVVDAGNGMGGLTVPVVFSDLPVDLTSMYFELDGSFPNHEANAKQVPTSALPSTGTPTVASSSTNAARSSRRPCSRPSSPSGSSNVSPARRSFTT